MEFKAKYLTINRSYDKVERHRKKTIYKGGQIYG